jgi:hypothetical protein
MDPLEGFEKQAIEPVVSAEPSPTYSPVTPAPTQVQSKPRSRALPLFAGLGLAIAAALFFWLSKGKAPPPPPTQPVELPAGKSDIKSDAKPDAKSETKPPVEAPVIAPVVPPPAEPAVIAAPPVPVPAIPPEPVPPAEGTVNLTIRPWGEVFINNVSKGVSPPVKRLKLPAGTYQLEIRNPAGTTFTRQLEVKPGEAITLSHQF